MRNPPVALVTGGSRRIGRAIVEDLAANGFAVALHYNDARSEAEDLAAHLSACGRRVAAFAANLSQSSEAKSLIPSVCQALGPLSLLINNASVFEEDSADDFKEEVFDQHFALHVRAPSLLAGAFADQLPIGGEGLIVNVIDQRVWRPTPRYYSYSLSKSALWAATRIMAQSFAPRIRVNAIGPGPTLPNARQSIEDFERQSRGLLLGHGPALDEFGATVRYFWAAKSVTGQMIALDGGQHLAWETPDVSGVNE